MTFTIFSPAFPMLGRIPIEFTREGSNVSPPLEWDGAPVGTRSFALLVEDPDAPHGIFRHWIAYDIPASAAGLKRGDGSRERVPFLRMGRNDFGNSRYEGPEPPVGHGVHHYHFRLMALDVPQLDVPARCSATELVSAARPHCLGEAQFTGLFENPRSASNAATRTPGGKQPGVADPDKLARTGTVSEPVRQTPPAGTWNDVASNE